jgi:uncharacterized protein YfcZ (UPF0381/DUF406 family)
MTFRRAVLRTLVLAVILWTALFLFKLTLGERELFFDDSTLFNSSAFSGFDNGRKNYASQKQMGDALTQAPGETQKYERIATIGQSTTNFDTDRAKVDALIVASNGLTQYELQQGLAGARILHLTIGVPPGKFDSFIEDIRKFAKNTQLVIAKTDKTNEYRQLRARRETLEKTRKALTEMAASGGSIDERLKVQAQLTQVEDKLQDLGVSLGDFNAENEFCTVKLTLAEISARQGPSLSTRAFQSFVWATEYFLFLAAGFLMVTLALWLAVLVAGLLVRAWTKIARD